MKYKSLFSIILIFIILISSSVKSLNEELPISCGGSSEIIIGCLGNEELIFLGEPSVQGVGSGAGGEPLPQNETIITIDKEKKGIDWWLIIMIILAIGLFISVIFRRRLKRCWFFVIGKRDKEEEKKKKK